MRYAVIARHVGEFPVRLMCRVLDVAVSGYYAWRTRLPSWRTVIDEVLMAKIRLVHAESHRTYGAPRVLQELRAAGLPTSQKRVARLMRTGGLAARPRRAFRVVTTNAKHGEPVAANVLAQQFPVEGVALNTIWVADITHIPTREGALYLATVLDLASRRCVGWAMQPHMETELALAALRMARAARRPAPGLIHHSDRGTQYASREYRAELAAAGMVASMSRTGNCYDNAVAESFFSTLEFELLRQSDWHTRADAQRAIFRYIELWYNRKRRHSTLGYVSPAEYEHLKQAA